MQYDFTYDKAGNLLSTSENPAAVGDMYGFGKAASGLGVRTSYTLDALNRVTRYEQADTATGQVTKRADYAYRADGSTSSIARFAGAGVNPVGTTTAAYDGMGRITGITHAPSASASIAYAYAYDAASRMTSMTSPEGTSTFTLDATDQLLSASLTGEAYAYDKTGNRTSGGTLTGSGNRLLFDGTYRYAYDAEGNRTAKFIDTDGSGALSAGDTDVTAYGYDYRNRLVAVSHVNAWTATQAAALPGFTASGTALPGSDLELRYTYDYADRRIRRMIDADGIAGAGQESVSFAGYAGDVRTLEIARPNDKLVIDSVRGPIGFLGQVVQRNFYGNGADEILAVDQVAWNGTTPTTSTFWTFTDHQDSVRDIVSGNVGTLGQVVEHRQYDSFGRIVKRTTGPQSTALATAGVGIDFGYAGRPLEARTGLSDNRARWYEPATGRFINEDPSGFRGGDANLFRYVGNDPLNKVDPSGLAAKWASYAGGISTSATMGSAVTPLGWSVLGQQASLTLTTLSSSVSQSAFAGLRAQPAAVATSNNLVSPISAGWPQKGPPSIPVPSNNVALGPISGWLAGKAEASRSSGGILGALGHMAYGTAVGPAALLDTVYPRAVPQAAFNAYDQAERVAATSSSPVNRAMATAAMGAAVYGGARAALPSARSTSSAAPVTPVFTTERNAAVFWSGAPMTREAAATWARDNRGMTLEMVIADRAVKLPTWNPRDPAAVSAWRQASREFAKGASGDVRTLQGDTVRTKSVWAEVEYPALINNPNVSSIRAIDAKTGGEVILWSR